MQPPATRFAALDGDRIAFQTFGAGAVPLVVLRARLASLETVWEHPAHLRLWRSIGERAQAVTLDFRGTGISDPVPDELVGDIDAGVADVLAVLDAAGMERVCVSGEFDSAAIAIAFAVQHPERVDKLVLINGFAKGCAGDGYELGLPAEAMEQLAADAPSSWGSGSLMAMASPHIAGDLSFAARLERVGARPRVAAEILRKTAAIDVRDLLPLLDVPTLVVYTGDISTVTADQSHHLAAHIRGARMWESQSATFYWGGGAVETILDFVAGDSAAASEHDLATVLFTDVVGSTDAVARSGDREWRQTLDFLDDLTTSRVARHGGRVVNHTGDGHLMEFARPRDAVDAALALVRESRVLGVALRAGLHAGEVERRESGAIGGLTVHIAARVAAVAEADEVVASRTVVDLLGATDHALTPRGVHELRGVPGTWPLFTIA
jgi:class 3 adenylate cyclase